MADFDAFNGDADGICALIQLRLAQPREARLVSGVKRDIQLLDRVEAGAGDRVTALDISLDKNRSALERLLASGAEVYYCDHHFAGEIPDHPGLTAEINTAPETCTSLIVNARLGGQYAAWAVVGAFGDNLDRSAENLARASGLEAQLDRLRELGVCINYNAYGQSVQDLAISPTELYRRLSRHATPAAFLDAEPALFDALKNAYDDDIEHARTSELMLDTEAAAAVILPCEAWSRRVSGVYGNLLANEHPKRAHAVLTRKADGGYLVSVRAPLSARAGADEVCRQFDTGGGRQAAAGINSLPESELDRFLQVFSDRYR